MRFGFENMRVGRPVPRWMLELGALANNVNHDKDRRRPKIIAGCDVNARRLGGLDHYRLTRDGSTDARANLFLYVAKWLDVGEPEWLDLDEPTPRRKREGWFRRAILRQRVEDWPVIVAHAPPAWEGAQKAREEWTDAVVDLLRGAGPRVILLSDPNGLGKTLRRRVPDLVSMPGNTNGEAVHGRGIVFDSGRPYLSVNGVDIKSDHEVALLGTARKP